MSHEHPISPRLRRFLSALPKDSRDLKIGQIVGLTNRTRNALLAAEVKTLGDLAGLSDEALAQVPSLGTKSLHNLERVLARVARAKSKAPGRSGKGARNGVLFGVAPLVESLPPGAHALSLKAVLLLRGRTRNALARAGVVCIGDLLVRSDAELLQERTFGEACLADLMAGLRELSETLAGRALEGSTEQDVELSLVLRRPFVEEVHRRLPPERNGRTQRILDARYFAPEPSTFDDIGVAFGITRERVRQIAGAARATLDGGGALARAFDDTAGRLRASRDEPLTLAEAERLEPWLAGASADWTWLNGALRALDCKHRVIDFGEGGHVLTLGVFVTPDSMLLAFLSFFAGQPDAVDRDAAARTFLADRGVPELLPLLLEEAGDCVRFEGRAYRRPTHAWAISRCLLEAEGPLRVPEIVDRVRGTGHAIGEGAARATLDRLDAICTGPSTYVHRSQLARYTPLAPKVRKATLELMGAEPDRQWSSVDLLDSFRARGSDWVRKIPELYVLDFLLEGCDEIVALGRRIFALRGHHAGRLSVADVLRDILVEEGAPMPLRELVARARRVRSLGVVSTLQWPLVRLADGRVGLGQRDCGLRERAFRRFLGAVRDALAETHPRMTAAQLGEHRDRDCPGLFDSEPYLLASLISAHAPELQLDGDGTALRRGSEKREGTLRRQLPPYRSRGLRKLTAYRWLRLLDAAGGRTTPATLATQLEEELDVTLPEATIEELLKTSGWHQEAKDWIAPDGS